jgi:hypothetical protein
MFQPAYRLDTDDVNAERLSCTIRLTLTTDLRRTDQHNGGVHPANVIAPASGEQIPQNLGGIALRADRKQPHRLSTRSPAIARRVAVRIADEAVGSACSRWG